MSATPIRVAICEDSRTYAQGLRRFLEADGQMQVVSVSEAAEDLVARIAELRPDLVTMDLELPGIDGVEAIRRIMAEQPIPIVVFSGHVDHDAVRVSAALAAGALEALAKSEVRLERSDDETATALRRRLTRLARGHRERRPPATRSRSSSPRSRPTLPRRGSVAAVGIAASAGGPRALETLLGGLPSQLTVPLLIVQHMSEGFTTGLVTWLDAAVPPPVRLAVNGATATPGVIVAPEGSHLLLGADWSLRLDRRPVASAHQPSADVLFGSMAAALGERAMAVVLTGMGRDGAEGVTAIRAVGGAALAERSRDATLWGMPASAAAAGATELSLADLGRVVREVAGGER